VKDLIRLGRRRRIRAFDDDCCAHALGVGARQHIAERRSDEDIGLSRQDVWTMSATGWLRSFSI